jgi:hypothetical protein
MIQFGDISVRAMDWIAQPSIDPEIAAKQLSERVEAWLASCGESDDPE